MADYISREAVLALGYWHGEHPDIDHPTPDGVDAVDVSDIEDMPAADVVPVVRCRGCKYGDYDSKPDGAMVCLRTNDGFWRKETDFCSYGKPKEDNKCDMVRM